MTKEEQQENNNNLRNDKDKLEKELEIYTTQEFINDKFCFSRSKMGKLATIGTPIFIGGFASAFAFIGTLIFTPAMFMEATPAVTSLLKTICLSAGLVGTGVSGIATYLRRKQDRRIFNKINNRLGENKLPENSNNHFEELGTICDKSREKIDALASIHLAYQDSKRELERFVSEDNIGENPVESAIRGAKSFDSSLSFRSEPDERIMYLEQVMHEEVEAKVEGPTLVKR